jgi:hypothetical protein
VDQQEEKEIDEQLLAKATDIETAELIIDSSQEKKKRLFRRVSIIAATGVWILIEILLVQSTILTTRVTGDRSAGGEYGFVALLGLLLVLFSNKFFANFTGFSWFISTVPINKPSPVILMRLTGWILLIVVLLIAISYF